MSCASRTLENCVRLSQVILLAVGIPSGGNILTKAGLTQYMQLYHDVYSLPVEYDGTTFTMRDICKLNSNSPPDCKV